MGVPAGPWYIDDLLTFTANTHRFDTGAGTDADSVPTYRVYEDETGTAILNGSMAKLDDANTVGFYSEQLTLSAANGFEVGKSYSIYVTTAVNSVTGTQSFNFKVIATTYPANVTQFGGSAGTFASGRPEVNTSHIAGSAVSTSAAQIGVNVVNAGGTAWASGAITAAVIATDAIDSDAIAANAVTEIQSGLSTLDAAGVRSAVGLASANLDTQLSDIDNFIDTEVAAIKAKTDQLTFTTANRVDSQVFGMEANTVTAAAVAADAVTEIQSGLATAAALNTVDDFLDTEIAAIKAKTDSLTFTVAGQVDANIQYVNDVQVDGTGAVGDEWGPV